MRVDVTSVKYRICRNVSYTSLFRNDTVALGSTE